MVQTREFKSQDKSLRKQMIIDAAVKVFHQKGYRTATLDDVANELGLTRPALYHYVLSKENLLSQIYIQALENFFATIYEITNMDLTPKEKLRVFVRRHLKTIVIKNLAMFAVFFSEENQLPQKDFEKIQAEKRKFTKVVEDIIEEGMAQGYFREVNSRLLADAAIGMCNWLYRWYKPGKSLFTPDEIVEQFMDFLEKGLLRVNEKDHRSGRMIPDVVDGSRASQRRKILDELKTKQAEVDRLVKELDRLT